MIAYTSTWKYKTGFVRRKILSSLSWRWMHFHELLYTLRSLNTSLAVVFLVLSWNPALYASKAVRTIRVRKGRQNHQDEAWTWHIHHQSFWIAINEAWNDFPVVLGGNQSQWFALHWTKGGRFNGCQLADLSILCLQPEIWLRMHRGELKTNPTCIAQSGS